ncbi:DNA excision repair protein ERCC-6-like 2 isoform X2 [Sorex araneus]|uniref:DNA excision repair protein ERCC-6-like 2 isoform X2 n=1 Tax=Sorex araneus TaxID=42254 RepID=UPI00243360CD|nr:DNA excision repair protein ERCC-6-like 2 isoform X2 [Sorex araneus]
MKLEAVISFLAAVLHKKGTREDIENNMPEFLLRSMKKESSSTAKKMFLVVAPLSVLYNWRDELDTWGYFRVVLLHGSKKDQELIRVKQRKCEIALTTYETLRLCLDELNSLKWSAVIVDEVHRIKNPKARVTEVMKALKCKVRIGLTGTILQNNMKELWCVMDWAVPGLLGSRVHFKKQFSDPVEHGQRHTATKRELATGREAMQRLAEKMSGWFLRRTKALIQDQLPKKEDRMVYCSLTDFQKAVYQAVLDTEDVVLILKSSEPCPCSSGRKRRNCCYKANSDGEAMKALYFSYLAVLQKVANHVSLLHTAGASRQQETLIKRICDQVFSRFPDFMQKSKDAAFETLSDPKYSGKMKVLQQLLAHCRKNGDKVLLFSFSTKLLDVLQQYCMASGLDYRRLDGSTKSEERVKIVKEFNSTQGVNVCLVSTMAGGLGLNFVGANVVVLFDPTWNPANDLQAIDRAYRIGQCRDVKVLRLISLGTVEEIMYLRQVYKQQLHCAVVGSENAKRYFEAVQGSKEHQGELFGVKNLFKLRSQGSCLTKDILEREGRVEAGVLTATTWLREEPQVHQLEKPSKVNCEEPRNPAEPTELLAKEPCDLCSDISDDEAGGDSRIKNITNKASNSSKAPGPPGHPTLLQCGFSKLFETQCKAVKESGENNVSLDGSSDEEPISSGVHHQESSDSYGTLNHRNSAAILNPNEEHILFKNEKILEQNTSSESDDEKKIKNTADLCDFQNAAESDESDIIFPTQFSTKRLPKNNLGLKPLMDESEGSETENSPKIRNGGNSRNIDIRGNGLISKPLSSENMPLKSLVKRKSTSDISDESDDIEISSKSRVRKQRRIDVLRPKRNRENKRDPKTKKTDQLSATNVYCHSQTIDDFVSSDDDLSVNHIHFSEQSQRPKTVKERINFSSKLPTHKKNTTLLSRKALKISNKTVVNQEQVCESMDKLLDGVQEVAYVHSNQNVIGSSKAENHMSHLAVRDVFELKQFSQLPANIAICTSKGHKEKKEVDTLIHMKKNQRSSEESISLPLCLLHPVSQKKKEIYCTEQTTFIIGETPKGIRRKQFEEMASFNLSSVKEFAEHITNATSEKRQKFLKDFYASRYLEIKEFFVDSASEITKFSNKQGARIRNKTVKKESLIKEKSEFETMSLKDSAKTNSQICSQKVYQGKSIKCQNHSACREERLYNSAEVKKLSINCNPNTDSEKSSQASKGTRASCSLGSKSEACERKLAGAVRDQQDLTGTDISRNEPPFKVENRKLESAVLENTAVVHLLGDTSILDDLFKSRGNSPTLLPRKSLSGPTIKTKQRPKDFWDILNEQNDDSLSKLTDVAVVETLCGTVPPTTASKRREDPQTSLWKSNENFLWKKFNSSDEGENPTNIHE